VLEWEDYAFQASVRSETNWVEEKEKTNYFTSFGYLKKDSIQIYALVNHELKAG
jgi:hypothetical protein